MINFFLSKFNFLAIIPVLWQVSNFSCIHFSWQFFFLSEIHPKIKNVCSVYFSSLLRENTIIPKSLNKQNSNFVNLPRQKSSENWNHRRHFDRCEAHTKPTDYRLLSFVCAHRTVERKKRKHEPHAIGQTPWLGGKKIVWVNRGVPNPNKIFYFVFSLFRQLFGVFLKRARSLTMAKEE